MCIRDRDDEAPVLSKTFDEFTRIDCWQAVSYTHLRAHETVLDLVCRLLLEKKKGVEHPLVTLIQLSAFLGFLPPQLLHLQSPHSSHHSFV